MNENFIPLDLMADSCLCGTTSAEYYLAVMTGCGLTAEEAIKRIIRAAEVRMAGKEPYSEIVGQFRFSVRIAKVCLVAEFASPINLPPEIQYAFKISFAPECHSSTTVGKQGCKRWLLIIEKPSRVILDGIQNLLKNYGLSRDQWGIKSPEIAWLKIVFDAWPIGIERYQNSPDIIAKLTSPEVRAPILTIFQNSLLPPPHITDIARSWRYRFFI
jgi:hypothetical protein